jgi:hypothetical protein
MRSQIQGGSTKHISGRDEEVIQEVLFKTLSLVCDLNILLKNYNAARLAVKDLEILQRNDANTYMMKLRVFFS